uniref:Phosphatase and actin regulator 4 n=2 Tax=Rattus norvegicus TaxID=10116 RepID=M0R7T1_RAT
LEAREVEITLIQEGEEAERPSGDPGLVMDSVEAGDTTPPTKRKSKFSGFGKIFKPWKWRKKKSSDKFKETSEVLERKISMRKPREELVKRGVLLEDPEQGGEDSGKLSHAALKNGHTTPIGSVRSSSPILSEEEAEGSLRNLTPEEDPKKRLGSTGSQPSSEAEPGPEQASKQPLLPPKRPLSSSDEGNEGQAKEVPAGSAARPVSSTSGSGIETPAATTAATDMTKTLTKSFVASTPAPTPAPRTLPAAPASTNTTATHPAPAKQPPIPPPKPAQRNSNPIIAELSQAMNSGTLLSKPSPPLPPKRGIPSTSVSSSEPAASATAKTANDQREKTVSLCLEPPLTIPPSSPSPPLPTHIPPEPPRSPLVPAKTFQMVPEVEFSPSLDRFQDISQQEDQKKEVPKKIQDQSFGESHIPSRLPPVPLHIRIQQALTSPLPVTPPLEGTHRAHSLLFESSDSFSEDTGTLGRTRSLPITIEMLKVPDDDEEEQICPFVEDMTSTSATPKLPPCLQEEEKESDSDSEGPIQYRDEEEDDDDDESYQSALANRVKRKDTLAMKLSSRPSEPETSLSSWPCKSKEEWNEIRHQIGNTLIRRLSQRPTAEELEQRNILQRELSIMKPRPLCSMNSVCIRTEVFAKRAKESQSLLGKPSLLGNVTWWCLVYCVWHARNFVQMLS